MVVLPAARMRASLPSRYGLYYRTVRASLSLECEIYAARTQNVLPHECGFPAARMRASCHTDEGSLITKMWASLPCGGGLVVESSGTPKGVRDLKGPEFGTTSLLMSTVLGPDELMLPQLLSSSSILTDLP